MGPRRFEKKATHDSPMGVFESYIEIGKNGHYPLFSGEDDPMRFSDYLKRPKLSKVELDRLAEIFEELGEMESFYEQKKFFELLPQEQKKFLIAALVKAVEEELLNRGPNLH